MHKKIVYLGFHKCGTTSFYKFLGSHGLKGIHNTLQVCDNIGLAPKLTVEADLLSCIDAARLSNFIDGYKVLTDNPFPFLYRHFDKSPGKFLFVLGTRPTDQWISSMQRYFGNRMPALGHAIYKCDGNACSNPRAFCETYDKHNATVREYFKRREDFIEIRLGVESNASITERLVDFLELPKDTDIEFGICRPN